MKQTKIETVDQLTKFIMKVFNQSAPICGVEIKDEWVPAVARLTNAISNKVKFIQTYQMKSFKLEVIQIKEKFGGLRYYVDMTYIGNDEATSQTVHSIRGMLEAAQILICESSDEG